MASSIITVGGRKAQRAILTFEVATFTAAAIGIVLFLAPIGYDSAAAGGIITLHLCILGTMLILLFVDCCGGCGKKNEEQEGYRRAPTDEK